MKSISYFTIAMLCGATLAIQPAQAQTPPPIVSDEACTGVFGLAPTEARIFESNETQWWFTPHAFAKSTYSLPLTAASAERRYATLSETVLTQWQSTVNDAVRWAKNQPYLIVREGATIRNMRNEPIGQFTQLIAKATWDARIMVSQNTVALNDRSNTWVAPLQITSSITEVGSNDRVIPRICITNNSRTANTPASQTLRVESVAEQAQILGFLDVHRLGARSSIAIMDKGAAQGVSTAQTWFLVEALNEPRSRIISDLGSSDTVKIARNRGQVELLQVFEHYATVRVDYSEYEVQRGTYLKRSNQTSLRNQTNQNNQGVQKP